MSFWSGIQVAGHNQISTSVTEGLTSQGKQGEPATSHRETCARDHLWSWGPIHLTCTYPGRVSSSNKPPNTPGSTERQVSHREAQGSSREQLSQLKELLCAATCKEASPSNVDLSLFMVRTGESRQGGRRGVLPAHPSCCCIAVQLCETETSRWPHAAKAHSALRKEHLASSSLSLQLLSVPQQGTLGILSCIQSMSLGHPHRAELEGAALTSLPTLASCKCTEGRPQALRGAARKGQAKRAAQSQCRALASCHSGWHAANGPLSRAASSQHSARILKMPFPCLLPSQHPPTEQAEPGLPRMELFLSMSFWGWLSSQLPLHHQTMGCRGE